MTRHALPLLGVLLLAACRSKADPLDRAIEQDPSAANYWQRADATWYQARSIEDKDPRRSLSLRDKALKDLDQAIALEEERKGWYLGHRGTWCAEYFQYTKDPVWRERSLAAFAQAIEREPKEERGHFWRGKALLTRFNDPDEAVTSLLVALRLSRATPRKLWELEILEQLAGAYAALATSLAGRPEGPEYRELAQKTKDEHDRLYRIKNKDSIEYFAAQRRAKLQAQEEGYRLAAEREARRSAEAAKREEEERRFREAHKECAKCDGRGWNYRIGYTEHKVDTVKTDKGLVIESKTTRVPSGAVACGFCHGKGYVPKE